MSDCAEKGFVRNAMHPESSAALRTTGSSFSAHVDHRHGNPCGFETLPQLDTRSVVQVDVENDTSRRVEIGVVFKGLCR
jgi:hypothetical protein